MYCAFNSVEKLNIITHIRIITVAYMSFYNMQYLLSQKKWTWCRQVCSLFTENRLGSSYNYYEKLQ